MKPYHEELILLLTGLGIYPKIYDKKSMSYGPCLLAGLIKNKGGVEFFQTSQKERIFISYYNQGLLGVIS